MNILGISGFYHDSAACLVQDGRIVCAVQEERFTRKKHDASFPKHAVDACLSYGGLTGKDIDYVAFYEKPLLKFERLLKTYLAYAPQGITSFLESMPLWLNKKLYVEELIRSELDYSGVIVFPEHHESHAASAFFPSPFQEATFITFDGVGEWATTSYGTGSGNTLTMIADIRFPHSLGLLYSAFTYYTGFKVNSGEYKIMGLAPYGEPKYKDLILTELIDLKPDGSFRMNMAYFNYCQGLTMTSPRFHRLFGGDPRKSESPLTQKHMDLARSIQEVTEEIMLRIASHAYKETGVKKLCLAGGVALNCVGNGRILKEGPYDDIWIQPAAGDAGGALGAALFTWYQYLGNERRADGIGDAQQGSYLGTEYSDEEIVQFLNAQGCPYQYIETKDIPKIIAPLIAEGNVMGWFQGRMEFGPRALGARSILGDARSPEMQATMNLKIKFREGFRPFAPAVASEHISEYFDIHCPSPYMLLVAPVKEEHRKPVSSVDAVRSGLEKLKVLRSDIPAVTHVDYSARIQSVHEETNPLLHALLNEFGERYHHPVLINTSFNVRGEPIVCTPQDAFRCFMRTHMDYLMMGNYLLDKKIQQPMKEDNWKEEFLPD